MPSSPKAFIAYPVWNQQPCWLATAEPLEQDYTHKNVYKQ